jgi:competence protein ComFB
MGEYKNVMEYLVLNTLDTAWKSLECCKCDKCKSDVIALTLNQLPSKYVVTQAGEVYARINELSICKEAEIITALAKSAKIVKEKPRHEK